MIRTSTTYWVGTALLLSITAAAMPERASSRYEARLTGAASAVLTGTAEFDAVNGTEDASPFTITLGAQSESGAVLFTRWNGARPMSGRYEITDVPTTDGIQALVVTGPVSRPAGVFRARSGSVTITSSRVRWITGEFEMQAVGFLAAAPDDETRELNVRGSFTASPSR
ncbi:MAG TPA: hypothetical protein VFU46_07395 [Gemmatimonadales bacterium]|nr:hypothetical protein [Gemmatimonadales bacterium]